MTGIEVVVTGVAMAGAAALLGYVWNLENEASGERSRLWGTAAGKLGRAFSSSFRWPGIHRIVGISDRFEVIIEGRIGKSPWTRWTVLGVPHNLHLTRESLGTSFEKMLAGKDIEVGHAPFDREVSVRGNEALILALLDDATRDAVTEAVVRSEARVLGGQIVLEQPGFVTDAGTIVKRTELLLSLARRLAPENGADRLVELLRLNATRDPRAGVRLRNLEVLVQNYMGNPRTLAALETAATSDVSHANRLFAAKALGPAGLPALRQVAEATGAPREIRLEAFERVIPHMSGSSAIPLLEALLVDADDVLAGRAALGLAQRGHRDAEAAILERFRRAYGKAGTDLAVALAAIAGPRSESALRKALEDPSMADETRAAVAHALGACGTIDTVASLVRLRDDPGQSRQLRSAAAAAVGRIQQRMTGAEAGQLSLPEVGGEAGRLAVAEDEAGRLSDPVPPPKARTS